MIDGLDQLASWVRHYFLRLVAEGFAESQALALAVAWQRHVLEVGSANPDE